MIVHSKTKETANRYQCIIIVFLLCFFFVAKGSLCFGKPIFMDLLNTESDIRFDLLSEYTQPIVSRATAINWPIFSHVTTANEFLLTRLTLKNTNKKNDLYDDLIDFFKTQ